MSTLKSLAFATLFVVSASCSATIATVYKDFDSGAANFASIVAGTGGTVVRDVWLDPLAGPVVQRAGYSVSRPDGSPITSFTYILANSDSSAPPRSSSGYMVDISPAGPGAGHGDGNGDQSKGSGVTLDFAGNGKSVNAIGFEVGDWSTCCQVSNIYISFDDKAPILVGSSTVYGDGFLTDGGAGVFVAAFDDSGSFSKVSFWGDGFGEFLLMGGTVHYATLAKGSLPPVGDVPLPPAPASTVPEPASLPLLLAGLAGMSLLRRRSRSRPTRCFQQTKKNGGRTRRFFVWRRSGR